MMRTLVRGLGYILAVGAGLAMLIFEVVWFYRWWGLLGGLVGLLPPIAVLFPFIYLVREGFNALYFGLWAASLVGVGLVVAANAD
jgi:hypothetical protein